MSEQKNNKKKVPLMLAGMGIAFFGVGFAMVPLYNLICSGSGINGIASSGGRVTLEEARQSAGD